MDEQTARRRLKLRVRNALTETLLEILPPWCEGVQDEFWRTNQLGRYMAELWLDVNKDEAMTLSAAILHVFGYKANISHPEGRILETLPHYPLPEWLKRKRMDFGVWQHARNEYVLKSDADGLKRQVEQERAMGLRRGKKTKG